MRNWLGDSQDNLLSVYNLYFLEHLSNIGRIRAPHKQEVPLQVDKIYEANHITSFLLDLPRYNQSVQGRNFEGLQSSLYTYLEIYF